MDYFCFAACVTKKQWTLESQLTSVNWKWTENSEFLSFPAEKTQHFTWNRLRSFRSRVHVQSSMEYRGNIVAAQQMIFRKWAETSRFCGTKPPWPLPPDSALDGRRHLPTPPTSTDRFECWAMNIWVFFFSCHSLQVVLWRFTGFDVVFTCKFRDPFSERILLHLHIPAARFLTPSPLVIAGGARVKASSNSKFHPSKATGRNLQLTHRIWDLVVSEWKI